MKNCFAINCLTLYLIQGKKQHFKQTLSLRKKKKYKITVIYLSKKDLKKIQKIIFIKENIFKK